MVDVAMLFQPRAPPTTSRCAQRVSPGEYLLVTAHRAGNVDDPARLRKLVDLLLALPLPSSSRCIRAPARAWRPRAARRARGAEHVRLTPPLGYLAFTALLSRARAVLTDSGGVQKEAYLAGVPCVTLRDTTEWVETVDAGWNVLVDLDGRPRWRRSSAGRRPSDP